MALVTIVVVEGTVEFACTHSICVVSVVHASACCSSVSTVVTMVEAVLVLISVRDMRCGVSIEYVPVVEWWIRWGHAEGLSQSESVEGRSVWILVLHSWM